MNLTLNIWRQDGPSTSGRMVTYQLADVSGDMSFLEMLDVLNESLIAKGEEPIAFDSDCREGICGMCGLMISGKAHGPVTTTTCQLHMREFRDGDTISIEPWRADAFPVIKDLVVDRCPNASAMLFMGAKVTHLGELPQGQPERYARVVKMVAQHDHEGFGGCTNTGACADACPKEIPLDVINTLNRDLRGALRRGR